MHNHIGLKSLFFDCLKIFVTVVFLGSCTSKNDLPINKTNNENKILQIQTIINKNIDEGITISRIDEMKAIESSTNNPEVGHFLCEAIAQELSFVGDYKESLRYMDKYSKQIKKKNIKIAEEIKKYKPQNAINIIEGIADSNQIIFINEAHHVPLHRAFSIRLLSLLYDKGFRYFSAETLNNFDSDLNLRGYPLISKTGYYSNEPLYGDLIRIALDLGYIVVPYENEIPCKKPLTAKDMLVSDNNKKDFNWDCQNHREYNQALNLYNRILKKDPQAKIFVHAGNGHISRKGDDYLTPMGEYFQKISGITPFTIDQESMREHSSPEFENEIYKYIFDKYKFDQPIILQSANNKIWTHKKLQERYDVQIFHPRTTFNHGRPNWLSLNGSRNLCHLENINFNGEFPYLVSAFIKNERETAVPIDQIILSSPKSNKALMLPKKKLVIIVKDKSGKKIEESFVNNSTGKCMEEANT